MALHPLYSGNKVYKKILRKSLLSRLSNIDPFLKTFSDHKIIENCINLILNINHYTNFALYHPKISEVNTDQLQVYLKLNHKTVFYPRIHTHLPFLTYHMVYDFQSWETGPLGIQQPNNKCPQGVPEIFIIPFVGFNKAGHRLGYGQGYFDRYFDYLKTQQRKFIVIGLGYSWQQIPNFFQENHDFSMDYIITEKEILIIHT